MSEPRSSRPKTRPGRTPEAQPRSRRQPPYAVVLHSDKVNGVDFVAAVLKKVFHYGRLKAFWLALKAHLRGKCIVWTGVLEVAELKAEQLRSCGPDPRAYAGGALPLNVSIEPLPD